MMDPAIKLFGNTIPVIGDTQDSLLESGSTNSFAQLDYADKESAEEETMDTKEESSNPSKEQETDGSDQSDEKESSNDAKNSQQEHLKKPDKIVPCPRCKSMDTKFCYYNNYNVNQPRHFCKNCQRYWTAGGSMRNVPVGSGRRKNKTSAFTISEPGLKSNGTLLTFGSETRLVESMVSSGSTVTSIEDKGPQEPIKQNLNQGFPNQMPCFQWPYMWSPPFCASAFPMPLYPIPWNIHWVPPAQMSPTVLGKHSRDGEMLRSNERDKGSRNPTVLVPKTLRIDDPDEAAKSSIWTTLGINKEMGDSISKGGFFNSIHFKKGEEKDCKREASPALKANPAALCRYVTFQENTDTRT